MFFSRSDMKARAAERRVQAARIAGLVREALSLGDEDGVTVNEIACPDPGCPDKETVILLMRRGEPTRAAKIAQSMEAVAAGHVAAALAEIRESQP